MTSEGRGPLLCEACGKPPEGRCPESENTLHVLPVGGRTTSSSEEAAMSGDCHDEGEALAQHYRDAMDEPLTDEQQEQAIRLLDTIAAGDGDTPPWRGLGVPHVSDLTDEEANDV